MKRKTLAKPPKNSSLVIQADEELLPEIQEALCSEFAGKIKMSMRGKRELFVSGPMECVMVIKDAMVRLNSIGKSAKARRR